ncbi:MAG TPA: hypothetical protein VFU51_03220 [Gaiellaceae bacterium]|nr:hypothetical protein [Gaiellaceae bacterium]
MSRGRRQRRGEKARPHARPVLAPREAGSPGGPGAASPRVVVREASTVERLAYTRSQAAQALGVSRSTLRRLLPYLETIELPWGTKLIPVDEVERIARERRRAAAARRPGICSGRPPSLPEGVVEHIRSERAAGRSYRAIADALNRERTPTAHSGAGWWPSTVRAVELSRVASVGGGRR